MTGWRWVTGGGYTPAGRWVVDLADGLTAFAKVGTTENTASWLRTEHETYRRLTAGFMPRLLGWDDGDAPILVLEDLSGAVWPPPWSHETVERVLTLLGDLRATPPPDHLPSLERSRAELAGWKRVAADPQSFLALGICSAAWLELALPALVRADAEADLSGGELLHLDVRSDNVCFAGERTLLVDWNLAAVGNATLDLVAWLPSLTDEGGPQPDELVSNEAELVALIAGYFADRARQPHIPDAPRVRTAQRRLLQIALPWAARALDLPPPQRESVPVTR